jgi:hypothetical protein
MHSITGRWKGNMGHYEDVSLVGRILVTVFRDFNGLDMILEF